MLRQALALSSSLQIGLRVREAVRRQVVQAALMAVVAGLVLAAVVFLLLALYLALLQTDFGPVASSALMAAGLLLVALVLVVGMRLVQRRRARRAVPVLGGDDVARRALDHGQAATEALRDLDRQLGRAVQQVGPLSVIAAAFAIGMAAGRRRQRR